MYSLIKVTPWKGEMIMQERKRRMGRMGDMGVSRGAARRWIWWQRCADLPSDCCLVLSRKLWVIVEETFGGLGRGERTQPRLPGKLEIGVV